MTELTKNLRWFKKLVAYSGDIIAILNEQMELLFVGGTSEMITGFKPHELKGITVNQYLSAPDIERMKAAFEKVYKDANRNAREKFRVPHKDGSDIYLEVIITNRLHDPDIRGFVVNARDETLHYTNKAARQKYEHQLLESERKYRGLFESIQDGILETDLDGCINKTNRAFAEMLGYKSPDELTGKYYQDLTHEKWHDLEKDIVENQIIARGHSNPYEKEYIKKDGSLMPIEIRVWLKKENGKPTGMWGIARKLDLCLCTIEKDVELALFRIVQEALTNVARHAGASKVDIIQQCNDHSIELIIEDNGKGIDIEQINSNNSFGLTGMREKAAFCGGDFIIIPSKKGTRIQVVIPK